MQEARRKWLDEYNSKRRETRAADPDFNKKRREYRAEKKKRDKMAERERKKQEEQADETNN